MARLSISQAAHTLGLSQSTIRKRLRSGDLQGQKVKGAGGFNWEVFVADDPTVKGDTDDANHTNNANGGALVEILREELAEKNRQISEAAPAIGADRLKRSPRAAMVADLEVIIWSSIGQWE